MHRSSERELNDHTAAVLTRLEREGSYTLPTPLPTLWPSSSGGPMYATAEAGALLGELRGQH